MSKHVMRPGKRKPRASANPDSAEAAHPLSDFIVPASDPIGRSIKVSATMAPDIQRIASVIVNSQRFPFKTAADVYRWCVQHGLRELDRRAKDEEITASYSMMAAWSNTWSKEMENAQYKALLQQVSKTIRVLLDEGHVHQAEKLAAEMWRTVDRMDDPYWRGIFRDAARRILERIRGAARSRQKEIHPLPAALRVVKATRQNAQPVEVEDEDEEE